MLTRATLWCLLLAAVAAAQGKVWVVDSANGPGTDFSALQPAIDAALSGDALLVRQGYYGPMLVDGKGLTLQAEQGAIVQIGGSGTPFYPNTPSIARGLVATQQLVLRGLWLYEFEVSQCQGGVWIEDCRIYPANSETPALKLWSVARVELARSYITGISGADCSGYCHVAPGLGLDCKQSEVTLAGCTVVGGTGLDAHTWPLGVIQNQAGRDAAHLEGGSLWASGSFLTGGKGGAGLAYQFYCLNGADGGYGLTLGSGAPDVHLQGCTLGGGAGGSASGTCQFGGSLVPGTDGQPFQIQTGSVDPLPGSAHALVTASPVREGQNAEASFHGSPGEFVVLGLSGASAHLPLPGLSGVLLLAAPFSLSVLGALPAGGSLRLSVPIGELGPGVEFGLVYLQGAFCAAGGGCALGPGSAIVLLDQSF